MKLTILKPIHILLITFCKGRNMVLIFRHGRRLEGGENALYGLKLSEVSTHVPERNRQKIS